MRWVKLPGRAEVGEGPAMPGTAGDQRRVPSRRGRRHASVRGRRGGVLAAAWPELPHVHGASRCSVARLVERPR